MEEKIKVYLSKNVYNVLCEDMELFEFYKKDGSLNKNEFLNLLIANYYDIYQKRNTKLLSDIKTSIKKEVKISELDSNILSSQILNLVKKQESGLESSKSEVTISITPTKVSNKVIAYIKDNLDASTSLSNFFRSLFASYTQIPRNKRETIIFNETYKVLQKAIKDKHQIYVINKANHTYTLSPYAICSAKEETFNYLLAEVNNKKALTFRLSRIKDVVKLDTDSSFTKENTAIFEKSIKFGPQYIINQNDLSNEIKVKLTSEGSRLYKVKYLNRPKYDKITKDTYYFSCSEEQIKQYFISFGKEAIVLSPKSLNDYFKNHYKESYNAYNKK